MNFSITRVSAQALAAIDSAAPGSYEHGQAIAIALEEGYGVGRDEALPPGIADAFTEIDAVIQQIKAEGDTATLSCWEHYRASVLEKIEAERAASITRTDLVFWHQPEGGTPSLIDAVIIDQHGTQRGLYSGKTQEELQARYSALQVADMDAFIAIQEGAMRTEPEPCTHAHYIDALEALPPVNWGRADGVESFSMCERIAGRMTRIYARVDASCWTFVDRCDLSQQEIAEKIKALPLAAEKVTA